MKEVTEKLKVVLADYDHAMNSHFKVWKRAGPKTSRGEFHWDEALANTLLQDDVKSGVVDTMTKKELWESREEYKEFDRRIFTKHVYQEKSKQIGGVYWQEKRNRTGRKKHDEEVRRLRKEFQNNSDKEVNDLTQKWLDMNTKL